MTSEYRLIARDTERRLSTILVNDEGVNEELRMACLTAILESSGYSDPDDALSAYRTRRDEFVQTCALYVRDEIWDLLNLDKDYSEKSLLEVLFCEVVQYADMALWEEMADTFMPDYDDLVTYVEIQKRR